MPRSTGSAPSTDVPQDPQHHGEGDVATHTRMAAARRSPRPPAVAICRTTERSGSSPPSCCTTPRSRSPRRTTRRPDHRARALPRRRPAGATGAVGDSARPDRWREHVAALIRHHQVPFWALERDDLDAIAFRVSLLARNADLVELARADIRGRVCDDADALLDNVDLYAPVVRRPRLPGAARGPSPSDHARFAWFRHPARDPDYAAYDDTTFTVTVMSGLPATGQGHLDRRPWRRPAGDQPGRDPAIAWASRPTARSGAGDRGRPRSGPGHCCAPGNRSSGTAPTSPPDAAARRRPVRRLRRPGRDRRDRGAAGRHLDPKSRRARHRFRSP